MRFFRTKGQKIESIISIRKYKCEAILRIFNSIFIDETAGVQV